LQKLFTPTNNQRNIVIKNPVNIRIKSPSPAPRKIIDGPIQERNTKKRINVNCGEHSFNLIIDLPFLS